MNYFSFKADPSGTHFWHSHTGLQTSDGVFGPFIVHQPKDMDPHGNLYDYDLPEHVLAINDWLLELTLNMWAAYHHAGRFTLKTALINGKKPKYHTPESIRNRIHHMGIKCAEYHINFCRVLLISIHNSTGRLCT